MWSETKNCGGERRGVDGGGGGLVRHLIIIPALPWPRVQRHNCDTALRFCATGIAIVHSGNCLEFPKKRASENTFQEVLLKCRIFSNCLSLAKEALAMHPCLLCKINNDILLYFPKNLYSNTYLKKWIFTSCNANEYWTKYKYCVCTALQTIGLSKQIYSKSSFTVQLDDTTYVPCLKKKKTNISNKTLFKGLFNEILSNFSGMAGLTKARIGNPVGLSHFYEDPPFYYWETNAFMFTADSSSIGYFLRNFVQKLFKNSCFHPSARLRGPKRDGLSRFWGYFSSMV